MKNAFLSPVNNRTVIDKIDQTEFDGFEYVNPLLMSAEDVVWCRARARNQTTSNAKKYRKFSGFFICAFIIVIILVSKPNLVKMDYFRGKSKLVFFQFRGCSME